MKITLLFKPSLSNFPFVFMEKIQKLNVGLML